MEGWREHVGREPAQTPRPYHEFFSRLNPCEPEAQALFLELRLHFCHEQDAAMIPSREHTPRQKRSRHMCHPVKAFQNPNVKLARAKGGL